MESIEVIAAFHFYFLITWLPNYPVTQDHSLVIRAPNALNFSSNFS